MDIYDTLIQQAPITQAIFLSIVGGIVIAVVRGVIEMKRNELKRMRRLAAADLMALRMRQLQVSNAVQSPYLPPQPYQLLAALEALETDLSRYEQAAATSDFLAYAAWEYYCRSQSGFVRPQPPHSQDNQQAAASPPRLTAEELATSLNLLDRRARRQSIAFMRLAEAQARRAGTRLRPSVDEIIAVARNQRRRQAAAARATGEENSEKPVRRLMI
jgi:hypothetical protein